MAFDYEGAAAGSCIRVALTVKKPCTMIAFGKSAALLRLYATVTFLCYLFAGVSFALPSESQCARCTKLNTASPVKSGTFCQLSYHRHDCHNSQGKSAGQIKLCPDGCLSHDDQGGPVASLAKFLSSSDSWLLTWFPVDSVISDSQFLRLNPFIFPPDPPPSISL